MPPAVVFANSPGRETKKIRRLLRGRWRVPARAVMVLLSLRGLSPAQIAVLPGCHPATVRRRAAVPAGDETHLHLLPHVRASRIRRGARPQVRTLGTSRQVTVSGALDVTAGTGAAGRAAAAQSASPPSRTSCCGPSPRPGDRGDLRHDSTRHAKAVTACLKKHPRLGLLYGARYSPHDNRPSGSGTR